MKSSLPEKNRRILVIDDNHAIHEDFRKILNATAAENTALTKVETVLFDEQADAQAPTRFQIDSAHQGQEGLVRVQMSIRAKCPYAMAFVDVRMPPGWDGVETTQKLWELDPDLQVVICTAYSDYSWDEMIARLGHSDRLLILKKPFDTVEVLQLAHALTEKWWLQQQVKSHVDELELRVANRTRQLQAITDAMIAFLQSGGEQVPSSILLQNALQQTGSECGFVAMVIDGPALRVLAHAGMGWSETPAGSGNKNNHLELTNLKNLFGSVITGAQAVISNEPGAMEGLPPGTVSLRRFLGVPILNGTQVVGMIGVASRSDEYTAKQQNKVEILTRAASILFDSYQRKQREVVLEGQLRQAQKVEAIGRLAGGVAHDFNNILTAILGYCELMLLGIKPDDELRGSMEEIQKAAQRAAALTRQLLAFSRKQILEPKVLNLNDAVKDLSTMLRRTIGEDIELVIREAADIGHVKVDPSQVEQVVINLAINARDAMPRGGKLTIETANVTLDAGYAAQHEDVVPGRYVVLTVSDTGIGMNAEVQARLFEPFFTTKEQGKGTGLGLATCHGIVKQSGGHISVYSEPGQGAVFKIYLPRFEEPAAAHSKPAASGDLPRGEETVLLVEDEPGLRKLASMVLRNLGYKVLEASDGREALHIAEESDGQGFDLVLTDVVMPQMSGKELADHLHAKRPETKVLFSSGYAQDTIGHHGVLEPGIAFLQKPYGPVALARKVRDVLDA